MASESSLSGKRRRFFGNKHLASAAEFRSHQAKRQAELQVQMSSGARRERNWKSALRRRRGLCKERLGHFSSAQADIQTSFSNLSPFRRSFPVYSISVSTFTFFRLHSADCNNRLQHEIHRRGGWKKALLSNHNGDELNAKLKLIFLPKRKLAYYYLNSARFCCCAACEKLPCDVSAVFGRL